MNRLCYGVMLCLLGCTEPSADPSARLKPESNAPDPPPAIENTVETTGQLIADSSGPDQIENSFGMKFVRIPKGTFLMGTPEGAKVRHADIQRPQHRVEITKDFYIGATEVTQGQWKAVTDTEPWLYRDSGPTGDDYPAMFICWDDAVIFCRILSRKEGKTYRLPWEAEWEYACRGGATTQYCFGDDGNELGEYAWWGALFGGTAKGEPYAHQVAQKKPNQYGLFDMHGNLKEWCGDWYDGEYYNSSPLRDPHGPTSGSARVLRGGSASSDPDGVRCASRDANRPDEPNDGYGFRVVLE